MQLRKSIFIDKKPKAYLNRLTAQNEKVFSSHHHKSHELVTQDLFNIVSLIMLNIQGVPKRIKRDTPVAHSSISTAVFTAIMR